MRSQFTQRLTLSALLCALCTVLSQIQIPLPPVPLSLSLLAVLIGGALLGPRWGAASAGVYIALGAAGVPVFAGFSGGVSVLFGPTGGFILGYLPCVFVTGALSRRLGFTRRGLVLSMLAGAACCYASGTLFYCAYAGIGLSAALPVCVLPFIPGDLIKIALASVLCLRLRTPLRAAGLC